jgi:hypothetical protein
MFHKILRLTNCDWVTCVWSEVCIVTRLRSGRPRNSDSVPIRGIKRPCLKMTSQIHPAPILWMNGASFPLPHASCMACSGSTLASLYSMYHIWYIMFPGTGLQAGRSWVRFPMNSLGFFNDLILPAALWSWGQISLWQLLRGCTSTQQLDSPDSTNIPMRYTVYEMMLLMMDWW